MDISNIQFQNILFYSLIIQFITLANVLIYVFLIGIRLRTSNQIENIAQFIFRKNGQLEQFKPSQEYFVIFHHQKTSL